MKLEVGGDENYKHLSEADQAVLARQDLTANHCLGNLLGLQESANMGRLYKKDANILLEKNRLNALARGYSRIHIVDSRERLWPDADPQ